MKDMHYIRIKFLTSVSVLLIALAHIASANSISGEIAFFAEHEGGLHMLDLHTSRIRELKIGLPNTGNLDFNGKTKLLVFEGSRGHHAPRSLYLLNIENNKKYLIYDANTSKPILYRPKFHPDGVHLYAVNYGEGIFRYSLSSKLWEKLQIAGQANLNPQGLSFSKSGKRVAISPGDFKGFLLARIVDTGLFIEKHLLNDFGSCIAAQWVGENKIVFAGRMKPGLQFIWSFDLETGELKQLTQPPIGTRDFLSLSQDEKTIVFTGTGEPLEWRLWQISIDGTDLKQLTKGGVLSGHLSPVWIQ